MKRNRGPVGPYKRDLMETDQAQLDDTPALNVHRRIRGPYKRYLHDPGETIPRTTAFRIAVLANRLPVSIYLVCSYTN